MAVSTRRSRGTHARHIRKLIAAGKTVKIITVGKKGYDILRRDFADKIIDRIRVPRSQADRIRECR